MTNCDFHRQAGADDVKKHKWFKGIDWDLLYAKQLPVRAQE